MLKKSHKCIDWGLFAVAAIIGISFCITSNLSYDEYYSVAIAKHNIPDIIRITSNDVHPPAYYIALHMFIKMIPVLPPPKSPKPFLSYAA